MNNDAVTRGKPVRRTRFSGKSCNVCGERFQIAEELQDHITLVHKRDFPYDCRFCHQVFENRGILGTHLKQNHSNECHPKEKRVEPSTAVNPENGTDLESRNCQACGIKEFVSWESFQQHHEQHMKKANSAIKLQRLGKKDLESHGIHSKTDEAVEENLHEEGEVKARFSPAPYGGSGSDSEPESKVKMESSDKKPDVEPMEAENKPVVTDIKIMPSSAEPSEDRIATPKASEETEASEPPEMKSMTIQVSNSEMIPIEQPGKPDESKTVFQEMTEAINFLNGNGIHSVDSGYNSSPTEMAAGTEPIVSTNYPHTYNHVGDENTDSSQISVSYETPTYTVSSPNFTNNMPYEPMDSSGNQVQDDSSYIPYSPHPANSDYSGNICEEGVPPYPQADESLTMYSDGDQNNSDAIQEYSGALSESTDPALMSPIPNSSDPHIMSPLPDNSLMPPVSGTGTEGQSLDETDFQVVEGSDESQDNSSSHLSSNDSNIEQTDNQGTSNVFIMLPRTDDASAPSDSNIVQLDQPQALPETADVVSTSSEVSEPIISQPPNESTTSTSTGMISVRDISRMSNNTSMSAMSPIVPMAPPPGGPSAPVPVTVPVPYTPSYRANASPTYSTPNQYVQHPSVTAPQPVMPRPRFRAPYTRTPMPGMPPLSRGIPPQMGMKRPRMSMRMPSSKFRRMGDARMPVKRADDDCEIIAETRRRTDAPPRTGRPSSINSSNQESTIHLNESITLSVRQPQQREPPPVQESRNSGGDANAVANLLATRGITVTPAGKDGSPGKPSAGPVVTSPRRNSLGQPQGTFAVPQSPVNRNLERPGRPPTVDLTYDDGSGRHLSRQSLTCQICDRSFTTSDQLRQHMQMHRTSNFRCNQCTQTFSSQAELVHHKNSMHGRLGSSDLAIPVWDLTQPGTMQKLRGMGVSGFVPLNNLQKRGAGVLGLPIVSTDSIRPGSLYQLQGSGAVNYLTLGPMRQFPRN